MLRHHVAILGALGVIVASWLVPRPVVALQFLDVGQGDAILVQSGSTQVLIDGGPGDVVLQRLAEEMPWFDRSIEVLVLTHPQKDHLEGLLHVLDRYSVSLVLLPEAANTSKLQSTWLTEVAAQGIPYRFTWTGQTVSAPGLELTILGPRDSAAGAAATAQDLNNASTIARLELCPKAEQCLTALLTGDAERRVERMLVAETAAEQLDVDVLKAGHHGSKTSTTAELIAAARPAATVISAGADNRFKHPHEIVLQRLAQAKIPTYRTDQDGTVSFVFDTAGWLLHTQN